MVRTMVLAVDDAPLVTSVVQNALKAAGIACDIANSPDQALRLMRQNLYFVVISDVHMPGMSGVEMVSSLKEISPLVQVIMLTKDPCPEQMIACADRGTIDFFEKNSNLAPLVDVVRTAVARYDRWVSLIGKRLHHTQSAQKAPAI